METSIVSGCETLPDFEAEAVAGAGAGVDEDPAGRLGGMEGGGSSGASNGLDPVGALLPLAPFSGGGPAGGSNGFDIVVYRRCSDEIDNTDLRRHYYRLASSIAVARQISWHLPSKAQSCRPPKLLYQRELYACYGILYNAGKSIHIYILKSRPVLSR